MENCVDKISENINELLFCFSFLSTATIPILISTVYEKSTHRQANKIENKSNPIPASIPNA